jgi:hypothetical protein
MPLFARRIWLVPGSGRMGEEVVEEAGQLIESWEKGDHETADPMS